MSDGKIEPGGVSGGRKQPFAFEREISPLLKNVGVLAGWIFALVLAGGLCWVLTQSPRNRFLQKAVNQALEQSGDSRRLGDAVKADSPGIGSWYSVTELPSDGGEASGKEPLPEGTKAFVFAFTGAGTFFPCAALVNPEGKVEEFIPLGIHGERMIKRVSPSILEIYARRIEGANL